MGLAGIGYSVDVTEAIVAYGHLTHGYASSTFNDLTVNGAAYATWDASTVLAGYRGGVLSATSSNRVAFAAGPVVAVHALNDGFKGAAPSFQLTALLQGAQLRPPASAPYNDSGVGSGGGAWSTADSRPFAIQSLVVCGPDAIALGAVYTDPPAGAFVTLLQLINSSNCPALDVTACVADVRTGAGSLSWIRAQTWASSSTVFGYGLSCTTGLRLAVGSPDGNAVVVYGLRAEVLASLNVSDGGEPGSVVNPADGTTLPFGPSLAARGTRQFGSSAVVWPPPLAALAVVQLTNANEGRPVGGISTWGFGMSLRMLPAHLIVGAPGAGVVSIGAVDSPSVIGGGIGEGGAVYVFDLPSAAPAPGITAQLAQNAGGDVARFIRQPTVAAARAAQSASGTAVSPDWQYKSVCRIGGQSSGGHLGSSLTSQQGPNGEQIQFWAGAPPSIRVLIASVHVSLRTCAVDVYTDGFRVGAERDIGYSMALAGQMGYYGSPSASNAAIVNPGDRHEPGRLYVKAWCYPHWSILYSSLVSGGLVRRCGVCPAGTWSNGGDTWYAPSVQQCNLCANRGAMPIASTWVQGAGCVWTCNAGTFGPSCLPCSQFAPAGSLPPNGAWVDSAAAYGVGKVSTCVWNCALGFSLNASAALTQVVSVNGAPLVYATVLRPTAAPSSACIPPPRPTGVLPIAVLAYLSASPESAAALTHSSIAFAMLLPAATAPFASVTSLVLQLQYASSNSTALGTAAGSTGTLTITVPISGVAVASSNATAAVRAALLESGMSVANATAALANLTAISFRAEGLLGATMYSVRVAAVNAGGQGPWSDPAPRLSQLTPPAWGLTTLPPVAPAAPSAPTTLWATPSTALLSWDLPAELGGSPLTCVEVCVAAVPGDWPAWPVVSSFISSLSGPSNSDNSACTFIATRSYPSPGACSSSSSVGRVDAGVGLNKNASLADVLADFDRRVAILTGGAGYLTANASSAATALATVQAALPPTAFVAPRSWDPHVYGRDTSVNNTVRSYTYALLTGLMPMVMGQGYVVRATAYNAAGRSSASAFSEVLPVSFPGLPSAPAPTFWTALVPRSDGTTWQPVLRTGIACVARTSSTISVVWGGLRDNGGQPASFEVMVVPAGPAGVSSASWRPAAINASAFAALGIAARALSVPPASDPYADASASAKLTGLLALTGYYVRVVAFNRVGSGPGSDTDASFVSAYCETGAPSAPTSPVMTGPPMPATAGAWQPSLAGGSIVAVSTSRITVSWAPPADDGGTGPGSLVYTLAVAFAIPSASFSGVVAIPGVGLFPGLPLAANVSQGRAYITAQLSVPLVAGTTISISQLPANTSLCFAVRANNSVGVSMWSNNLADPTLPISAWFNASNAISVSLPRVCATTLSAPTRPDPPTTAPVAVLSGVVRLVPDGAAPLSPSAFASAGLPERLASTLDAIVPAPASAISSRALRSSLLTAHGATPSDLLSIVNSPVRSGVSSASRDTLTDYVLLNVSTTARRASGGWVLLSVLLPQSKNGLPVVNVRMTVSLDTIAYGQAAAFVLFLPSGGDGTDVLEAGIDALPLTSVSFTNITDSGAAIVDPLDAPLNAYRNAVSDAAGLPRGTAKPLHALVFVNGLMASTAHYFRAAAQTATGWSTSSSRSIAVVTGPLAVPSQPSVPGVLQSGPAVVLTWLPPLDAGGVPPSSLSYRVYIAVQVDAPDCGNTTRPLAAVSGSAAVRTDPSWMTLLTSAAGASSVTITTLRAGGVYSFAVSALSSVGEGPASAPLWGITTQSAVAPQPPALGSITGTSSSPSTLRLTFTPSVGDGGSDVLGYRAFLRPLSGPSASTGWTFAAVLPMPPRTPNSGSVLCSLGLDASMPSPVPALLTLPVSFVRAGVAYAVSIQTYNKAGPGPLASSLACNISSMEWPAASACPIVSTPVGFSPQSPGQPRLADSAALAALNTLGAIVSGARASGRGSNSVDILWPMPRDLGGLDVTEARILVSAVGSADAPTLFVRPVWTLPCALPPNAMSLAQVTVASGAALSSSWISRLAPAGALCVGWAQVTGLLPRTNYSIAVLLRNEAGMGHISPSTLFTTDEVELPSAVSGLRTASASESVASAGLPGTGGRIVLSWPAVVDVGRAQIVRYAAAWWTAAGSCACSGRVDAPWACNGTASFPVASLALSLSLAVLADLCPNTTFSVTVAAVSTVGTGPPGSLTAVASPASPPGPVAQASVRLSIVTGVSPLPNALRLHWSAPLSSGGSPLLTYSVYLSLASSPATFRLDVPAATAYSCGLAESLSATNQAACVTISADSLPAGGGVGWCADGACAAGLPNGTYSAAVVAVNELGTGPVPTASTPSTGAALTVLPSGGVVRSALSLSASRAALLTLLSSSGPSVTVGDSSSPFAPVAAPSDAGGAPSAAFVQAATQFGWASATGPAVAGADAGRAPTVSVGPDAGTLVVAFRWPLATFPPTALPSAFLLEVTDTRAPASPVQLLRVPSGASPGASTQVVAAFVTGLEAAAAYVVRTAACNDAGCGPFSSPSSALSAGAGLVFSPRISSTSTLLDSGSTALVVRPASAGALARQGATVLALYVGNKTVQEGMNAANAGATGGWRRGLGGASALSADIISSSFPFSIVSSNSSFVLLGSTTWYALDGSDDSLPVYGSVLRASSAPWPLNESLMRGLALQPSLAGLQKSIFGLLADSSYLIAAASVIAGAVSPSSTVGLTAPSTWTAPGRLPPPDLIIISATQGVFQFAVPASAGGRPLIGFVLQLARVVNGAPSPGLPDLDAWSAISSAVLMPVVASDASRMSATVDGLTVNTTYVVRMFAANDAGGALAPGSAAANASFAALLPSLPSRLAAAANGGALAAFPAGIGNWSDWSPPFRTNTPVPPEAPSGLAIDAPPGFASACAGAIVQASSCLGVTADGVRLAWIALAPAGRGGLPLITYRIYISATPALLASARPVAGVNATGSALPAGAMAAADAAGMLSVRPPNLPLAPSVGSLLAWTVDVGCAPAVVLTGLSSDSNYSFSISAVNGAGESDLSGALTVRTAAPTAPLAAAMIGAVPMVLATRLFALPAAASGSSLLVQAAVPLATGGVPLSHVRLTCVNLVSSTESGPPASAIVGAADCILAGDALTGLAAAGNASASVLPVMTPSTGLWTLPVMGYRTCAILVRGLAASTAYSMTLVFVNSAGLASPPVAVNASTGPATPPAAPVLLKSWPFTATSSTVDVSWPAAVDEGGSRVTAYHLQRSSNGIAWTNAGLITVPPSAVPSVPDAVTGLSSVAQPATAAEAALAASSLGVGSRGSLTASVVSPNSSQIGVITGLAAISGLSTTVATQRAWWAGAVVIAARPAPSTASPLLTGDGDPICGAASSIIAGGLESGLPVLVAAVRDVPSNPRSTAEGLSCATIVVRMTQLPASQPVFFRIIASSLAGNSTTARSPLLSTLPVAQPTIDAAGGALGVGGPLCVGQPLPTAALPALSVAAASGLSSFWARPSSVLQTSWPYLSATGAAVVTLPATAPGPVQSLAVSAGSSWLSLSWAPPLDTGGQGLVCYRIEVAYDGVLAPTTDLCDTPMEYSGYSPEGGYATTTVPPPPARPSNASALDASDWLFSLSSVPPVGAWMTRSLPASTLRGTLTSTPTSGIPGMRPTDLNQVQFEGLTGITAALSAWLLANDVYGALRLPFGGVWNSTARLSAPPPGSTAFTAVQCAPAPTPLPAPAWEAAAAPLGAPVTIPPQWEAATGLPRLQTVNLSLPPSSALLRVRVIPVTAVFEASYSGTANAMQLPLALAAGPTGAVPGARLLDAAAHAAPVIPSPSPAAEHVSMPALLPPDFFVRLPLTVASHPGRRFAVPTARPTVERDDEGVKTKTTSAVVADPLPTLAKSAPRLLQGLVPYGPSNTAASYRAFAAPGSDERSGAPVLMLLQPVPVPAAPPTPVQVSINASHATFMFGPPAMPNGGCGVRAMTILRSVWLSAAQKAAEWTANRVGNATPPAFAADWSIERAIFVRDDLFAVPLLSRDRTATATLLSSLSVAANSAGVGADVPTPLSITDGPLPRASLLRYRAVASNDAGSSAPSSPLTITLLPSVPGPPSNLSCTTGARSFSPVSATLTWFPPSDDGGRGVIAYRIELAVVNATGTGQWTQVNTVPPPLDGGIGSFNVTGLTPSSRYAFRVAAWTSVGLGVFAPSINVTTLDPLPCRGQPDPASNATFTGRGRCSGNGKCAPWNGTCACDVGWGQPGCAFLDGWLLTATFAPPIPYNMTRAMIAVSLTRIVTGLYPAGLVLPSRIILTNMTVVPVSPGPVAPVFPLVLPIARRAAEVEDGSAHRPSRQLGAPQPHLSAYIATFILQFTPAEQAARVSALALNGSVPDGAAPPMLPIAGDPSPSAANLTRALLAEAQRDSPLISSQAITSVGLLVNDSSVPLSAVVTYSLDSLAFSDCMTFAGTGCSPCVQAGCGWCTRTGTCLLGGAAGSTPWVPDGGGQCAADPTSLTALVPAGWIGYNYGSQTRPVCSPACQSYKGCTDCMNNAECGWCEGSQMCENKASVAMGNACSGALAQTMLTLGTQCPISRCRTRVTQAQCLYDQYCGFCSSGYGGYCGAGDAFGIRDVSLPTCSGTYLFRSETACGFAPTAVPSCESCTAKKDCGFCATTGQCGVASKIGDTPAVGSCADWYYASPSTQQLPRACPARSMWPREICMAQANDCISCVQAAASGCAFCSKTVGGLPSCMLLGDAVGATAPGQLASARACRTDASIYGVNVGYTYWGSAPAINNSSASLSLRLPFAATVGCPVKCAGTSRTLTSATGSLQFGSSGASPGAVPQFYGLTESGTCIWVVQPMTVVNASVGSGLVGYPFASVTLTVTSWDLAPGDAITFFDGGSAATANSPLVKLAILVGSSSGRAPISMRTLSGGGVIQVMLEIYPGTGGQGFAMSWVGSTPGAEPLQWWSLEYNKWIVAALATLGGCMVVYTIIHRTLRFARRAPLAARQPEETMEAAQRRAQRTGRGSPRFVIASFPIFVFDLSTVDHTPMLYDTEEEKGKDNGGEAVVVAIPVVPDGEGEEIAVDAAPTAAPARIATRPTCAICLGLFEDGENIRVLLCRHGYHKECIDPSLALNKACPMCRRDTTEMFAERMSIVDAGGEDPLMAACGPKAKLGVGEDGDGNLLGDGNDAADYLARGRLRAQAASLAMGSRTGTGSSRGREGMVQGVNPMLVQRPPGFGGQPLALGGTDLVARARLGRAPDARGAFPTSARVNFSPNGDFSIDNPVALALGGRSRASVAPSSVQVHGGRPPAGPSRPGSATSGAPPRPASGSGLLRGGPPASAQRRRMAATALGIDVSGMSDEDLTAILAMLADGAEDAEGGSLQPGTAASPRSFSYRSADFVASATSATSEQGGAEEGEAEASEVEVSGSEAEEEVRPDRGRSMLPESAPSIPSSRASFSGVRSAAQSGSRRWTTSSAVLSSSPVRPPSSLLHTPESALQLEISPLVVRNALREANAAGAAGNLLPERIRAGEEAPP